MPACLYWLFMALEAHNAFLGWVEWGLEANGYRTWGRA